MAVAAACPSCGSDRLYKDGLRHLSDGSSVQRWLCRNCGYRFTESNYKAKTGWKNPPSGLNPLSGLFYCCQGNNDPNGRVPSALEAVRTLAEVEKENERRAAGATEIKLMLPYIEGRLIEYLWKAKKHGLSELTIKQRVSKLRRLVKMGADLLNPDSVSTALAISELTPINKKGYIVAYKSFAKSLNLQWEPPKIRVERKVPFIPTEAEIDTLIAGCGR
ncbi:MAG: transposase, partial [Candidatus Bathycorpusculaceae bacterium]